MNIKLKAYSDSRGKIAKITNDFNFKGLDLSGQTIEDVFFTKLNLEGAKFRKTVFKRCSFDFSTLVNVDMQGAIYDSCSFRSADMTAANITQATVFKNCTGFDKTKHKQKFSKTGRPLGPTEQRAIELRDWKLNNRGFVRNGSKTKFLKIMESFGKLK